MQAAGCQGGREAGAPTVVMLQNLHRWTPGPPGRVVRPVAAPC